MADSSFVRLAAARGAVEAAAVEVATRKEAVAWYDPALRHVVARTGEAVAAFPVGDARSACGPVDVGAVAVHAKFSLDLALLAVQVSDSAVVVLDFQGAQRWRIDLARPGASSSSLSASLGIFSSSSPSALAVGGKSVRILDAGLIWSDHGGTSQDLVVVTSRGAEFYKVSINRAQCRHVRSITYDQVGAFWYCAPRRLLILGCGARGDVLRAYWFKRNAGDLPRFELPAPDKVRRLELELSDAGGNFTLEPSDVAVFAAIYGATCLAHVDRPAREVRLFVVTRERCAPWRVLRLYVAESKTARLSVADDLIHVHCCEAQVTLTYDPLVRDGRYDGDDGRPPIEPVCAAHRATIDASVELEDDDTSATGLYNYDWRAMGEGQFLDLARGRVLTVGCRLRAMAEQSSNNSLQFFRFLLRRKDEDVGGVVAELVAKLVAGRAPVSELEAVLGVVAKAEAVDYRHVVSHHALCLTVFDALLSRRRRESDDPEVAGSVDAGDVVNGLLLYLVALDRAGVAPTPDLALTLVRALEAAGRVRDVAQLLRPRGPIPDSPEVATALARLGFGPLACDMLHRLRLWRDLLAVFADAGALPEAIGLCRDLLGPAERRELFVAQELARAAIVRVSMDPATRRSTLAALQRALRDWRPQALRVAVDRSFPFGLFAPDDAASLRRLWPQHHARRTPTTTPHGSTGDGDGDCDGDGDGDDDNDNDAATVPVGDNPLLGL